MAGLLARAGDDDLAVFLLDAHFGIEVAADLALGRIDTQARPAHALDAHNHGLAPGGVGVTDADGLVATLAADLEVTDVALALEDLGESDPGLGRGHVRVIVAGHERVPDPREHVGDGICDHALTS